MNDIVLALKNPAWWVLTVVVGLALNALAPFVNRWVESAWAARSEKRRTLLSAEEASIKRTVEALASNPTGLLQARLDTVYWTVRIILVLSVYLMAIQLCFAIPMAPVQLLVALCRSQPSSRSLACGESGSEGHESTMICSGNWSGSRHAN